MTLFAELIRDVRDQTTPLSVSLRKAKDLAHRLKSQAFIDWVNTERMGYIDITAVPDYRWVRLEPMVDVLNELFPGHPEMGDTFRLEEDKLGCHRSIFERFPLVARVEELEGFAGSPMSFEPNPAVMEAVRESSIRQWGRVAHRIHRVWGMVPGLVVLRVMAAVHDRLFNFLLKVRDEYPDLAESEKAFEQVRAMKIEGLVRTMIFNQNCTIEGGQGVGDKIINVGAGATVHGNVTVADAITNSFNAVPPSTPDPVKDLLSQLANILKQAIVALAEGEQKDAAEEFESLAKEASRSEPRLDRLRTYGVGLKNLFAKAAGSQAATWVTGKVDELLSMFNS
ncbi:Uncharacterized protein OS=Saccharophagus degradans (strain 2-40 / ATCC 43961 / DSM 17024) GN=Sde_1821 PE=4 SV=1 [Gemmata massiliana]|uniref:AbiTii domain-containing protein n=1 Tax=Gemmata massiliana TaxID=1210884 RepID=A0A6P2CU01_9BACT|nr:hypothetical protein [Gemmata massiliana]VTR92628.1 Uncharacterized protein OS=Saccharophagus degradans (strain 2-40 / ATCC 43961 / DSM 17024) GN=Sde_1821 PE=4 SV=1 [Gemmata massiliana]